MHPILFKIGPLPVYAFGLMVMLGLLAGLWVAVRLARREGLPAEALLDVASLLLISAIAGARLLFVLLNLDDFQGRWMQVFSIWSGGLSFHGAVVGGVLAGWWYCRRHKLPFLALADVVAPGLALGYAIGRIGCLLNGCCYGGPGNVAWAVQFPHEQGGMTPPSHPTQIYSALFGLAMYAALLAINRRKTVPGQVILSFVVLYSIYRFIVEFWRAGYSAVLVFGGLTQAQVASILIAVIGVALIVWLTRRGAGRLEGTGRPEGSGAVRAAKPRGS